MLIKQKSQHTVWESQAVAVAARDVHNAHVLQILHQSGPQGSELCYSTLTAAKAWPTAPCIHLSVDNQINFLRETNIGTDGLSTQSMLLQHLQVNARSMQLLQHLQVNARSMQRSMLVQH